MSHVCARAPTGRSLALQPWAEGNVPENAQKITENIPKQMKSEKVTGMLLRSHLEDSKRIGSERRAQRVGDLVVRPCGATFPECTGKSERRVL